LNVLLILLVVLLWAPQEPLAQTLAFPTAEGGGRLSQGGRGGKAYNINSLSAGVGTGGTCNAGGCTGGTITLRDCLSDRLAVGKRTCIFKVGGAIDFGEAFHTFETPPYVTVAGQTAPGNGIITYGLGWYVYNSHNVIARHIRMRGNTNNFMQLFANDNSHDVIYDHISAGWNTDDSLWCSYGAYNCTFQWILMTEGMKSTFDAYNKCCGTDMRNNNGVVSYLHMFVAQLENRAPWSTGGNMQWINNIVYNMANGDITAIFAHPNGGKPPVADIENNYYLNGPQQTDLAPIALASSCYPPESGCTQAGVDYAVGSQIYLSGNYSNLFRSNNSLPEDALVTRWYTGEPLRIVTTKPAIFPAIASMIPAADLNTTAYLNKIGAYAGLPQGRDAIDTRGIASFTNNSGGNTNCGGINGLTQCCSNGQCGNTGVYNNGTAYVDTDGDGMSDAWEDANGLNKNDASDGPTITASGYSNLELFLNNLAGDSSPIGPTPPDITSNLVAYYPFDDSATTATDATGKNHTGVLVGSPTYVTPPLVGSGKAMAFNGTNQGVRIADAADLDLTGPYTIAAWVKQAITPTAYYAVMLKGKVTEVRNYALYLGGCTNFSGLSGGHDPNSLACIDAGALTSGVIAHLAVTYDGTTTRLYKNGAEVAVDAATVTPTANTGDLTLAHSLVADGVTMAELLTGTLDDVRVYSRALSAADITALYNFNPGTPTLRWALDDGVSPTADTGSAAAPGTLVNGPTWSTGCMGQGLTFNGVDQYVTNTSFAWPSAQPVTASVWVKTAGGTPNGTFNVGGGADHLGAHIPYSDNILYWDHGPSFITGRLTADFTPYLGKWTHVALVSNGTTFRGIYINGALVDSSTTTSTAPGALTGVELGRYNLPGGAYYQTGQLDDFQLYNTVLTATDIGALYAAGSTCIAPSAPLPTLSQTGHFLYQ